VPILPRLSALRNTLFRRKRLESDLDAELSSALETLADRYVARGMSPEAARLAAQAALGGLNGIAHVKDEVREVRVGHGIETTIGDLRYAWRGLRRTPGFGAVAILTLGLGIGSTSAIFSVVRTLLLSDLPFQDGSRLVFVWHDLSARGYPRAPLAGPEIVDLRDRARLFAGFGGIWSNTTVLTGEDPEQLRIGLVTHDFFTVLGAAPALGRTFTAEDAAPTASGTILLSHALWQRRFAGDRAIVGRAIQVANRATTVIGVMPPGFRMMMPPDASVPDDLQAWLLLPSSFTTWPRGQRFLRVVGRMKPGVQLADAQQEIDAIGIQLAREYKRTGIYGPMESGRAVYAVGLHADGVREVRPTLLALFAGVSLLLVVACVNVASLLIARAAARGRETAVRIVLGADTRRLFRQYAVEGLLLGALGGLAGLLVGRACLAGLVALRPAALGRIEAASIDPGVTAFTIGLALTWGLLLSLGPLAQARSADIFASLQLATRGGGSRLLYRRRAALVVFQLALSVVLLVSAGLLARGFVRLAHVDPGFTWDNVVTFRLSLSGPRFEKREAFHAFAAEFRSRLAGLPGVVAAGAISHLPYDDLPNWGTPYVPDGRIDRGERPTADTRAITPGFFEAVGARLLEGRFFTEADTATSTPVAIVDERLARHAWPGESAIGKRFTGDPYTTGHPSVPVTVVGVVRHLRHRQPAAETGEQIYYPHAQAPRNPMAYVVRSSSDPGAIIPQVRKALADLDRTLPIYDPRPLSAYVVAARAARRFTMILAAAFAGAALALAVIGVYGVTAYASALRRREFGVRLALGATRRQIVGLVMGETVRLGALGLALGLAGAAVAATLLRSQLFGLTPADPLSYALAVPVLAAAVSLAAWLPAQRATRISPMESLRAD
jgi:predicted permease